MGEGFTKMLKVINMENLGLSSPNFQQSETTKHDRREKEKGIKINAFQTTSEFYNPNKLDTRGKQSSSLPRVMPKKKANYVSDNELSMDMGGIIDDEEFELKRDVDREPKVMKVTKVNKNVKIE